MTPEALLVHYADDTDAKLQMMFETLMTDGGTGPMTGSRNPLRQRLYRGPLLISEPAGEDGAPPENGAALTDPQSATDG